MSYADLLPTNIKWINMINKAGNLVHPSPSSVQAAMTDFLSFFNAGNFSIDIFDAGGATSWPMAYQTYVTLKQNSSTFDCTIIHELLNFVTWVQTNDAYVKPSYQ